MISATSPSSRKFADCRLRVFTSTAAPFSPAAKATSGWPPGAARFSIQRGSWSRNSQAPATTISAISSRPKEILDQLASHKLFDDPKDTFERTKKHLADNGVDIEKTRLTVGPWLRFDPDKEQFVGNAAADAMLTREYRKPFVVPTESEV